MPEEKQNELAVMSQLCEVLDGVKDKAMQKRIVDWVHAKYGGAPMGEKSIMDMLKEIFPPISPLPPAPYVHPIPYIYPQKPDPWIKPYDPPYVPWIITTQANSLPSYKLTAINDAVDGHENEHHPMCASPGLLGWRG